MSNDNWAWPWSRLSSLGLILSPMLLSHPYLIPVLSLSRPSLIFNLSLFCLWGLCLSGLCLSWTELSSTLKLCILSGLLRLFILSQIFQSSKNWNLVSEIWCIIRDLGVSAWSFMSTYSYFVFRGPFPLFLVLFHSIFSVSVTRCRSREIKWCSTRIFNQKTMQYICS